METKKEISTDPTTVEKENLPKKQKRLTKRQMQAEKRQKLKEEKRRQESKKIIDLQIAGYSVADIEKIMGYSQTTIWRRLAELRESGEWADLEAQADTIAEQSLLVVAQEVFATPRDMKERKLRLKAALANLQGRGVFRQYHKVQSTTVPEGQLRQDLASAFQFILNNADKLNDTSDIEEAEVVADSDCDKNDTGDTQ